MKEVSEPFGLVPVVCLTFADIAVPGNSNEGILVLNRSYLTFSLANTSVPPARIVVEEPVTVGAVVIEKHITLDRNMEGGDHKASLEPKDFKNLTQKIRKLETALGDGVKRCMPSEKNVSDVARKSIVAARNIKSGEIIGKDSLGIKRPGTGIPPKYLEKLTGGKAKVDIPEDQMITWSQIDLENLNNNSK